MDWLSQSIGQVAAGVPSKPFSFTFVPIVHKLPIKSIIGEEWRPEAPERNVQKIVTVSHEERTPETVPDERDFKAERVFIRNSAAGGAGNRGQMETEPQLKPSTDGVIFSQTRASPPVSARSVNTLDHADARAASMETAVDQHGGLISQRRCHDPAGRAEVSLGCFANSRWVSEDRTSPTDSADLCATPASSRESILSEVSDREKSWSAVPLSSFTSPASFSRTVSPCSSVRSGVFSPAVVQIKRHFLAPGSSLVNIPQSCFSSCESLSSSLYPQSPSPRHRPPLTRLSLLTAILRKGRLPILSSALQRPYTPCWPVNPVTLSFCNACSAASSVASIPLEFSSRFSSSTSIDSQSHAHWEANRCITAPPGLRSSEPHRACTQAKPKRCSEHTRPSSAPKWEEVISTPPSKSNTPSSRVPLPRFSSNLQSISSPKCDEAGCDASRKLSRTNPSIRPQPTELQPSTTHMFLKGHAENDLKKLLISPTRKTSHEPHAPGPQKWNRQPNSSLSKLHLLSQRLRSPPACSPPACPPPTCSPPACSPPACPPHLQHSHSCATIFHPRGDATSPLELDTSRLDAKSAPPPRSFSKTHCLSPSRYTPVVFSGWASPISTPTPTPSPAPPMRDLAASPSFSLRSTPSPRPASQISDCSDREGKKRKTHKIKLSYKSLAAIPTNTLLLDQQAIDDQIESHCDAQDGAISDTHAEMCSPAQLRQQSEELYATIDEILASSIPESSRPSTTIIGQQKSSSSFPKSLGRETKYASVCSLHPTMAGERKLMDASKTKPGVIRPMTAIPRLTTEEGDEFHSNRFRQSTVMQPATGRRKVEKTSPEEAARDLQRASKSKMWVEDRKPERRSPFFVCDLQITEPEEEIGPPGKDASTTFSPAERRMEASETHI